MDKIGTIEIKVTGDKGVKQLSPDNYDVREIVSMLENIEDLLYPTNRKDRPLISYSIQAGSIRHVFRTNSQAIIGLSAILDQVQKSKSIDFLEMRTAQALENLQNFSYQKNYDFEITTSVDKSFSFKIKPQSKYFRTENIWMDAEFYFYGMITNAGGKNKASIHLDTEEFGRLIIKTDKDYLKIREENVLYKKFGIRAIAKQNIETGEIDKTSLTLIELIDFNPEYDENYLRRLIKKARKNWKGVDPDEWVSNLRGGYDA